MLRSIIAACSLILAAIAIGPAQAFGQERPGLEISVQPLIVQFAVAPGSQASTHVIIKNVGTQPTHVSVNQIDWSTTVDGSVKTGRPGMTGKSSLNPYLRLSGGDLVLEPGETRDMTLTLFLPSTFPSGTRDYWGGYLVRATGADAGSFGVGANVLVYETVGAPVKHLKLTGLHVEDSGNGNIRLVARMLNDGQTYLRPLIHLQIGQEGRIVQAQDDSTPAIFAGEPRIYTRKLQGLAPGSYLLDVTLDYGGSTLVEGTTRFTVH